MKHLLTILIFLLANTIIYGQVNSILDNDKLQFTDEADFTKGSLLDLDKIQINSGFSLFHATPSQLSVGSDLQKSTLNGTGLLIQQFATIPSESSNFGINELSFTKTFSNNTNQWNIVTADNGSDRIELKILESNSLQGISISNPFTIKPHDNSSENSIIMNGLVGINTSTPGDGLHIKQKNDNYLISDVGALRIERNATVDAWTILADHLGDLTILQNGNCIAYLNPDPGPSFGEWSSCGVVVLKNKSNPAPTILDKILKTKAVITTNQSGQQSYELELSSLGKQLPSLVKESRGQNTYNKSEVAVLAIKAIQEQQALIETQQNLISQLQLQNNKLEKRMAIIEDKIN